MTKPSASRVLRRWLHFGIIFWDMGVPGMAGFGLDLGKARAGRGIRNANKVLASGALDLPTGKLRFAFQGLIAMRTIELKIG